MVDVVVNNVMALSTNPDLSTFLFKDQVCSFRGRLTSLLKSVSSHNITHTVLLIGATLQVNKPAGWVIRMLRFLT